MSDHLPECVDAMIPDFHNERWICICSALRACEQRVLEQNARAFDVAVIKHLLQEERAAALDAAREAVERVSTLFEPLGPALAAIDALREEQK